jgi:flagellar M-ring protein FliF
MLAQVRRLFDSLTRIQKILVVAAALAVGGGMWWLNDWNRERGFQPLFTRLSAEDAGAVVAKLKESGVEYRLSENGATVLVPRARVAELRIQLASAGVPKSGRIGYELFDKNNFGITDFAEQVNYRRALEGELERSVLALAGVESARVHITPAKDSVFTDAREPAKASILITLKSNAKLPPDKVDAIAHLVSSAVQGLDPEHVSVVDHAGRLLPRTVKVTAPEETEAADRSLVYRQKIEKDLLDKINSTLEPLLGAKRFRAGVSVECDFSSGEQSEETFDPEKQVVATSQKTDEAGVAAGSGGQPGSASNLPRPALRPVSQSAPITRKTENTTYQNSRVVRKVKLPQGTIRRVSVSVLLDSHLKWEVENGKAKKTLTPPSADEIKSIRELVSGIAGADTKRGDAVIVEALTFDSTLAAEPPPGLLPPPPVKAAPESKDPKKDSGALLYGFPREQFLMMAGIAGGALLALLGGGFWLLKKRKRGKARIQADMAGDALPSGHSHAGVGKQIAAGAKGGAGDSPNEDETEPDDPELVAARKAAIEARQAREVLGSIQMPDSSSKKAQVLTKHISHEAKKNPEGMAQIVRTWLNGEEG